MKEEGKWKSEKQREREKKKGQTDRDRGSGSLADRQTNRKRLTDTMKTAFAMTHTLETVGSRLCSKANLSTRPFSTDNDKTTARQGNCFHSQLL